MDACGMQPKALQLQRDENVAEILDGVARLNGIRWAEKATEIQSLFLSQYSRLKKKKNILAFFSM